jgi:hypothetical protein
MPLPRIEPRSPGRPNSSVITRGSGVSTHAKAALNALWCPLIRSTLHDMQLWKILCNFTNSSLHAMSHSIMYFAYKLISTVSRETKPFWHWSKYHRGQWPCLYLWHNNIHATVPLKKLTVEQVMTKILLFEHPKVYSRGHISGIMSTESSEPSPHLTSYLFRSIIKSIIIKINFNINLPSIPTFPSWCSLQRFE